MAKKKNIALADILKGKFLVDQGSTGIWRFIFFLIFLGLVMISSSHWLDQKIVRITALQQEVSDLKSRYANIHEELTNRQSRSVIEERALKDSLFPSAVRPYYLIDSLP